MYGVFIPVVFGSSEWGGHAYGHNAYCSVITNVSVTASVELRVSPFRLPPYVQLNHGIQSICSAVSKSFTDRIRYMFDLAYRYDIYGSIRHDVCIPVL